MAAEIARLFPGCPAPRAQAGARRAAARGSGRVGLSAAGRALDPGALSSPRRLNPPRRHRIRRTADVGARALGRPRARPWRAEPGARWLATGV